MMNGNISIYNSAVGAGGTVVGNINADVLTVTSYTNPGGNAALFFEVNNGNTIQIGSNGELAALQLLGYNIQFVVSTGQTIHWTDGFLGGQILDGNGLLHADVVNIQGIAPGSSDAGNTGSISYNAAPSPYCYLNVGGSWVRWSVDAGY